VDQIDYSLLYRVQKLTTGANVHVLHNAVFYYKTAAPGSSARPAYEELLRKFVAARSRYEAPLRDLHKGCNIGI
jgi:hypothetical protein